MHVLGGEITSARVSAILPAEWLPIASKANLGFAKNFNLSISACIQYYKNKRFSLIIYKLCLGRSLHFQKLLKQNI